MNFRNAFEPYLNRPQDHQDIILFQDDEVLIIKDKFPKSLRHYLILPRRSQYTKCTPLVAFNKFPELHRLLSRYVDMARKLIVDDLLQKELIDSDDAESFEIQFIQCGVHSIPSLDNLHIHVMTKDFYSPRLKHKKHYNSFNTSFFVPFEDLGPVAASNSSNDTLYSDETQYSDQDQPVRYWEGRDEKSLMQIIKTTPLRCSYCQASFGNSFVKLKQHLELEFGRTYNRGKNTNPNSL